MEDELKEETEEANETSSEFMELNMLDLTSQFELYYNMLTCSLI